MRLDAVAWRAQNLTIIQCRIAAKTICNHMIKLSTPDDKAVAQFAVRLAAAHTAVPGLQLHLGGEFASHG